MYKTETFPLYHPVHGECVADEATAPERLAAGWTKEKPEVKPTEGGKGK